MKGGAAARRHVPKCVAGHQAGHEPSAFFGSLGPMDLAQLKPGRSSIFIAVLSPRVLT